jgi:hypothetical protein
VTAPVGSTSAAHDGTHKYIDTAPQCAAFESIMTVERWAVCDETAPEGPRRVATGAASESASERNPWKIAHTTRAPTGHRTSPQHQPPTHHQLPAAPAHTSPAGVPGAAAPA